MTIKNWHRMILWVAALYLAGCQQGPMSLKEFVQYTRNPDNGLMKQVETAEFRYELQYQPPSLVAYQLVKDAGATDPAAYRKAIQDASRFCNFQLVVRNNGNEALDKMLETRAGSKDSMANWQKQLYYDIQNRFSLYMDQDTIPCTFYYTQPMGKIENAYNIMLAFEYPLNQPPAIPDKQLVFVFDDPLFSRQRLEFPFTFQQLSSLPELIF